MFCLSIHFYSIIPFIVWPCVGVCKNLFGSGDPYGIDGDRYGIDGDRYGIDGDLYGIDGDP